VITSSAEEERARLVRVIVDERSIVILILALMVIAIPSFDIALTAVIDITIDAVGTVASSLVPSAVIVMSLRFTSVALKEIGSVMLQPEYILAVGAMR
jgi:hypothetical protein